MSINTDSITGKTNYSVWDGSVASSFDGGKGTKESPYLISNGAQLAYMREVVDTLFIDSANEGVNYENSYRYEYYKLTCDIHLGARQWIPIGSFSLSARGNKTSASFNFNGDDHVIYGLEISQEKYFTSLKKYVGLFGVLDYNSIISNLKVVNGNVNGTEFVGGIAGILRGKIENCAFSGTVNGKTEVGGIVGKLDGHIFNCSNEGTISGNYQIGGLAGKITEGYIHSGVNYGIVKGKTNVGGIVGHSVIDGEMSSLILCINNGSVNGTCNVAGIAGAVDCVSYCVNRAKIQGEVSVGGICGVAVSVDHCYNDATVEGSSNLIGGIAGESYETTESINNGLIKGNNQIGGIVGRSEGREIKRCYNRGIVSGNGGVGGIIGNATLSDYVISGCYNGGFVINSWAGGPILGSHEGTKECEAQIVDSYYRKGCILKKAVNLSNFQYIDDFSTELTAQNKEIVLTSLQQNKNSIQDMSLYDTMAYKLYAEYVDKIILSVIELIEKAFPSVPEGSGKVVIAVVGEDRASSHNAFKDTIGTFIKDNPSMDIRVIYADEHNSAEHVLQEVISLSKTINGGIDHLRIEAHSDPNGITLKLNDQLVAESDWDKIAFSSSAYIRFTGCNTGGTDGIKSEDSIAQKVSNKTGKIVYGFLNNTSQRYEDGRYFQAPTAMYTGQKVVNEYTKFTPVK